MIHPAEETFVRKFVLKGKRERYLQFLSGKNRSKITSEIHNLNGIDLSQFVEITGGRNETDVIAERLKEKKNINTCYVISYWKEIDSKTFSVKEALDNIVGREEIILVFGNADLVYCEGEAPGNRYISK